MVSIGRLGTIVERGLAFSAQAPKSKENRSPGWHSSISHKVMSVENRIAFAWLFFSTLRLTTVSPARRESSATVISRSARTLSRWHLMVGVGFAIGLHQPFRVALKFLAHLERLSEDEGNPGESDGNEPQVGVRCERFRERLAGL